MDGDKCIRFKVSGRVQGVYYRASAAEKATSLELAGWVRNRNDGGVEGVACGNSAALKSLISWLNKGPPNAEVRNVEIEAIKMIETFQSFEIRY